MNSDELKIANVTAKLTGEFCIGARVRSLNTVGEYWCGTIVAFEHSAWWIAWDRRNDVSGPYLQHDLELAHDA
jgi:hypothetical protein